MVSLTKALFCGLAASAHALSLNQAVGAQYEQAMTAFGLDASQSIIIDMTFPGGPDVKPVPGDSPVQQCDANEPQILNLQKLVTVPNPPVRGQNLTFIAVGQLSQDIVEGAYVEVDVRYGFIKLIHQTFDLCEEITKVDLECPILKGEQVIKKVVQIPEEVPPGRYIVNARAYTKDDIFITCLTATVDFPPTL